MVLTSKAYESFQKLVHLTKRQAPKAPTSFLDTFLDTLSIVTSIPSLIWNGSTAPFKEGAPKLLVPEVETMKSPEYPYAKRVKVRVGPFRMPQTSEKNFDWLLWNMQGGSNNVKFNIKKPCESCTILRIESGIE